MTITSDFLKRASTDQVFRHRLLSSPAAVLAENGVELSVGSTVEAIDVRRNEIHLNLGLNCEAPEFQKVFDRAECDGAFRSELLASPKATLAKSLGEAIPAEVTVRVHDRPPAGVVRLFVPPMGSAANDELSDAELAGVAGGSFFKSLRLGIGNFLCRDMIIAEANHANNSYQIVTMISPGGTTNETGSLIVW